MLFCQSNEILIQLSSSSMYFRNTGINKGLPQDLKPTPFPRTTTSASLAPAATAPGLNTLNKNCHELITDDYRHYQSASSLNLNTTDVNGFLDDDDTEELDDMEYSTDPHQRLIL